MGFKGSRISFLRSIENFIGKVKSTGFASTYSGNSIDVKITSDFELETIVFYVCFVQENFKNEIEIVHEIIAEDLSNKQDNNRGFQYGEQGYPH
jgi:hypothetical protein